MLLDRLALELVDAYGDRRYGLSARSLMCGPPACRAGPGRAQSLSIHPPGSLATIRS